MINVGLLTCGNAFPFRIRPCIDFGPAVSYLRNKGSIAGPNWKIPFMGPFLESMNPKFEEYQAKWASGELSCVSVFHK